MHHHVVWIWLNIIKRYIFYVLTYMTKWSKLKTDFTDFSHSIGRRNMRLDFLYMGRNKFTAVILWCKLSIVQRKSWHQISPVERGENNKTVLLTDFLKLYLLSNFYDQSFKLSKQNQSTKTINHNMFIHLNLQKKKILNTISILCRPQTQ